MLGTLEAHTFTMFPNPSDDKLCQVGECTKSKSASLIYQLLRDKKRESLDRFKERKMDHRDRFKRKIQQTCNSWNESL